MRYLALACDYDGTLASAGQVAAPTLAALERLRGSGRRVILITGRQLPDLLTVFPAIRLCDLVVAENGGLLYRPATLQERQLADPPPQELIEELRARNVPVAVGRVILATWQPHETTVLAAIRDLGIDRQLIFNKGAVMVLPSGVNKATGLEAALAELELTVHNTVGIGDAENDHAFLRICECSAAVANALPIVKDQVDLVMGGDHGAGVIQLVDTLLENDLQSAESRLTRHHLLLGTQDNGEEVRLVPYGVNLLIAGTSGSGKSTLATGLLERMTTQGYQFCVIDPEGDYSDIANAVVMGNAQGAPGIEEVLKVLKNPAASVVINLVGLPLSERPGFFLAVLPRLQELRTRTGRPHWLLVDEAHHVLPAGWTQAPQALPQELMQFIFVTVHPESMALPALATVDIAIAFGNAPDATLREVAKRLDHEASALSLVPTSVEAGQAIYWNIHEGTPVRLRVAPCRTERLRHRRKYAEGDLGRERSFYFTGPENKLNLRAQNLLLFLQLAEGVDDETWTHHLQRHDYSRWFREAIKDDVLAEEALRIEECTRSTPQESREQVRALVTQYYTLPDSVPAGVEARSNA